MPCYRSHLLTLSSDRRTCPSMRQSAYKNELHGKKHGTGGRKKNINAKIMEQENGETRAFTFPFFPFLFLIFPVFFDLSSPLCASHPFPLPSLSTPYPDFMFFTAFFPFFSCAFHFLFSLVFVLGLICFKCFKAEQI